MAEPAKGKPKPKGKGANPNDAFLPTIVFTSPNVMALLKEEEKHVTEEGLEAGPGERGNGMEVEIELALNGQQFVSTGIRLRFEPSDGGKGGAKAGKKKK